MWIISGASRTAGLVEISDVAEARGVTNPCPPPLDKTKGVAEFDKFEPSSFRESDFTLGSRRLSILILFG